jgi:predicted RNA-binding protein with PUA-like domain
MPLEEMRSYKELAKMLTLRRGNRLSITPVTDAEWKFIAGKLGA